MSGPRTYQVRPGDTLSGIALRQSVPLALLVRINGISDINRIYIGQVLRLTAPSGSSLPPAPVVPQPLPAPRQEPGPHPPAVHQTLAGQVRGAPQSISAEDFLSPSRGSHSPAAVVIGCAEGNRTAHGGFVWSSFGHTDPGNGLRNLGSFSSQMTPEREQVILGRDIQHRRAGQLVLSKADKALATQAGKQQIQKRLDGHPLKEQHPEVAAVDLEGMYELIDKADRLQLEAMRARIKPYVAAAQNAGLDPSRPLLLATYFDSFNQSEAASSRLLKQFPFIKAQPGGITQETMVAARCRSWIDPSTQNLYTHLDKRSHKLKEYGSNFRKIQRKHNEKSKEFLSLSQVIRADQSRRIGEMVKALAYLDLSAGSPPAQPRSSPPPSVKPKPAPPRSPPSAKPPPSLPELKGDAAASSLFSALPPRLTEVAEGKRVLIPGNQDGSKDTIVSQLQRLLAFAMPQWSAKLDAERGRFGSGTQGALVALQRANKLPSATGGLNAATLELLKFEVYSQYFLQRGATLDTRVNVKTLLGLRTPTSTKANDGRGTYDDRFVMLWREGFGAKRVREFRGNADPAGEYLAQGYGVDVDRKNGKELGRLQEGYYVYHRSAGYHGWLKGKHVLRSKGSVPIEYDVNHDGQFSKSDTTSGRSPKADDILIHAGSRQTTGSAGCMTLPPEEFQRLWSTLGTQQDIKYLLVTLDGDTSVQVPRRGMPPPAAAPKQNTPATNEPTAARMVQVALSQAGKKYVFGTEVKLDDPSPKAFDCSELIQWAVHQAGGRITDGSQAQRQSCHAHRTNISVSQALKTRGALLFTDSHVAISLGNGMTIEAANSKSGVKSLTAYKRGWIDAGLVPGLHYGDAQPKNAPQQSLPPAKTSSAKTSAASPPSSTDIDVSHLGVLSSRYESKGDPGCVSGGVDDPGGISYGLYQFATTQGTPRAFVAWLQVHHPTYAQSLKALNPGTPAFGSAWKRVAGQDASGFGKAQHEYIAHTFYSPAKQKLESNLKGLDFGQRSQTLNDVLWSTAVQHSPAGALVIFRNALAGKSVAALTDAQIATAVYQERGRRNGKGTLVYFTRVHKASTRQSLLDRFKSESADAVRLLQDRPATKAKASPRPPPSEAHAPVHPPVPAPSAPPLPTSGGLTLGHGVRVNTEHPWLKKLATAKLHNGAQYMCTTTTRANMVRLGIPGAPGLTGEDPNNPRGAMVQMFQRQWTSVPFPGAHQEHIRSHYGNVVADVITPAQYNKLALKGQIPDGAIIFQTKHGWSYGVESAGSDMGIVRNRGRTTHNYEEMPSAIVYHDCVAVVIMVPREALQSVESDAPHPVASVSPAAPTPEPVASSPTPALLPSPSAGPVTPAQEASKSSTTNFPSWNFEATHFPGYYDASRDSDDVYNLKRILSDVPHMWKTYGALFKKIGGELQADPYALAAYCIFESYDARMRTYYLRMGDTGGGMVAAGIAATQAQDVKGKRIPGLNKSFPSTTEETKDMLLSHPEYGVRCLASEFKRVYHGKRAKQDLALAFPIVAFPAWGGLQRKRGAYGTQPMYVSRAYCLYKAFQEADRLASR